MPIVSNQPLSRTQQEQNVDYIAAYFRPKGWTDNAIAGLLGNTERESYNNFGLWQNQDKGDLSGGFGLVQWTPATKYINWAQANGYPNHDDWYAALPELERITYEVNNNVQWIPTNEWPQTFSEFTTSTMSPEDLAEMFLDNYERAGIPVPEIRRDNARYWYNYLTGLQTGYDFVWPVPDCTNVTSTFRPPSRPNHNGVDIACTGHHDIVASTGGTVSRSYVSASYGETVWIETTIDGQLYEMIYAHMEPGSRTVQQGDTVSQCQKIGVMGSTGDSTGQHLHFEIHKGQWNPNKTNAVAPLPYIQGHMCGDKPPQPPQQTDILFPLWLSDCLPNWS